MLLREKRAKNVTIYFDILQILQKHLEIVTTHIAHRVIHNKW